MDTIPAVFKRLEKHYNRHPKKSKMYKHAEYWPLLEDKVKALEVPVLIIGGENDFIDPHDFELMHEYISNSELAILQNAPHFPMWSDA